METSKSSETADRSFSIKVTLGITVVAVAIWVVSLLVLPVIDARNAGIDSWTAICRAIGIGAPPSPSKPAPSTPASKIAWTEATSELLAAADAAAGEAMAQETCHACHIPNGLTADPETIPSVTGVSALALLKQLSDMRDGHRRSDVMAPMIVDLTDKQLADVAVYYSKLPARNHHLYNLKEPTAASVILATKGDSARDLPACESCHSRTAGGPLEAPTLTGQYPAYVVTQLKAYAAGERRNDIYSRMRIIAKKLTDQEMKELGDYYDAAQYPR